MYYEVEEIKIAIDKAIKILNNRTEDRGFVRGYSDCFMFLVEYDKALRGKESKAGSILDFEYSNAKEFITKLWRKGYKLKDFAIDCNYELQTKPKPMFGDIAYMDGTAIIAGDYNWVTVNEDNKGARYGRPYSSFERHLQLLARPLRN